MADEARRATAGKLRLRRRRPSPPLPGRLQTFACSPIWFEEQGLSSAQSTWVTLLRTVDPHLNCASLEKAVRLPEFLRKSSQTANPPPNPEAFHVGAKQFQWVPLPLHHRKNAKGKDPKSPCNSEKETTNSVAKEGDGLTVISNHEQEPFAAAESGMRYTIKPLSKLEGGERTEKHHSCQPNSGEHSALMASQSHPKTTDFQKLWKESAIQGEEMSRRGSEKQASSDTQVHPNTLSDVAASTLPARESPSVRVQMRAGDPSEEPSTLDQCPMCQVCFTGPWSKLDIDSHLAKCLSESAEDVFW